MRWLRRILLAAIAFAALVWALIAIYVPPNDLDRDFVNDGADKDLRVFSNTRRITVFDDSKICEKWEITLPAYFYYFDGYYTSGARHHWWRIDRLSNPEFPTRLQTAAHFLKTLDSTGWDRYQIADRSGSCRSMNERDIHITGRLAKLPDKYGHRVWVRLRQGEKVITFAVDRHLTEQEATMSIEGRVVRLPLDQVVQSDILAIGPYLDKVLVPVPSIRTRRYEQAIALAALQSSALKNYPPVLVGRAAD